MAAQYTLPDMPYAYDALEPHIDAETMELHHSGHHQTYVNKLNTAIENYPDLVYDSIHELMKNFDQVPADVKTPVRNHGGGHSNHSIFWTIMGPDGGGEPSGDVASAIDETFGSFKEFRDKLTSQATALFGSGWAWLAMDAVGKLEVIQCPNQDSPFISGYFPIVGIDVWEHAYYLKHRSKRDPYIEEWWNVVNWDEVNRRFQEAQTSR